jgi:ferredoxin-type protein NapG
VEACPATAIFPLAGFDDAIDGTPVVDPDRAACVVCDGLQCTHVCPSGALLPLLDPAQIDMGVAEVYESNCIRKYGEDCDLCLVQCPLGAAAIDLDPNDMPRVNEQGCVGCGVCQFACPPEPKAIVVKPRAAGA